MRYHRIFRSFLSRWRTKLGQEERRVDPSWRRRDSVSADVFVARHSVMLTIADISIVDADQRLRGSVCH
jgi:hypothetical protein